MLEYRSRSQASRPPANDPAEPDVKGFLDYRIEARQAFEDLLGQFGSFVEVHNEWIAILAAALDKVQKLDAKGTFSTDKQRDLRDKQLLAHTAAKLDKVTAKFSARVDGLASAVERLAANQAEHFKDLLRHDLERDSLIGLRDQFVGFQTSYRVVRDRQIGWRKAINESPGQTREVIRAGKRYVAVLTRSIAAYKQLDEHVDRMIEMLDQKLRSPEAHPPAALKSPIPNLRDLFLADFPDKLRMHRPIEIHWATAEGVEGDASVIVQAYLDFAAGSRFVGFFVGAHPRTFEVVRCLAAEWDALGTQAMEGLEVQGGHVGQIQQHSTKDLKASGRVFVYHEDNLAAHQIAAIEDAFSANGASVILRGQGYAFSRRTV